MKSSTVTSSDSVELQVLIFCFIKLKIGIPALRERHPPKCPWQLGWVACNPSIHHFKMGVELACKTRGKLILPLRYWIIRMSFFQSSTSGFFTLVVKNATAVEISGPACFVRKSALAIMQWKTVAFASSRCLAVSLTWRDDWQQVS